MFMSYSTAAKVILRWDLSLVISEGQEKPGSTCTTSQWTNHLPTAFVTISKNMKCIPHLYIVKMGFTEENILFMGKFS